MRTLEETGRRMVAFRRARGIRFETMARRCGTTGLLLEHLEQGEWITHPHIAARVCHEYELDVDDYNALVHKRHRQDALPAPRPKPEEPGYSAGPGFDPLRSIDELVRRR